MGEESDEQLALATQNGDTNAFGFLVEKYEEKIKRYIKKFIQGAEAEDITQDIFLKAFKNINSFKVELKFSPWLYRISHNEMVNFLKKKKTLPLFDFDVFLPHYHVSQKEMENEADKKEELEQFKKCLDRIEPKYKEVVVLYYFENLSYQEIATITHSPVSTVGVKIKRAKEKLKQICHKQITL
ncbi:MAG: RNA polymerase sigma factor [Candidatus Pacebacteria bacterium]|nr:RNA polymerase sigma factor [Candidatus Paceibacterota bacterium]